ncbi:hypothetical protein AAC387_Pa10g0453 [Persea americana]
MASAGAIAGLFFLSLALYCGIDPFKHSPISNFPDFEAYKGPESMAFVPLGRGPYTGVADGRILFWNGESWRDFAYTSPNRSGLCDPKPSPLSYMKNEHICGRPLGLRFDKKTGDLYIADAYFGLMKVGPEGGLATSLVTEAEGVPLRFTNDLDIDDEGNIYFTDSSAHYQRRNFMQLAFSAEDTGRLLKYEPLTQRTTVLPNLQFPNGVSMSRDGSFFVFSKGSLGRLRRFWLKGNKAGTSDVFALLPGFPDNFFLKLPIPAKVHFLLYTGGGSHALLIKFSPDGEIVEVLEDRQGKVVRAISEVEDKDGKLWMGSVLMPFVGVYQLG